MLLRGYTTLVGVVYDPFLDEMWTAVRGQKAKLNGKPISVSSRSKLDEAIVAMGFAKYTKTLALMLPVFNRLVHRVRKVRLLGAAALSMTWTANGRLDAYIENGVRLWDVAAGGLIVECAGGEFWWQPVEGDYAVEICVSNGSCGRSLWRSDVSAIANRWHGTYAPNALRSTSMLFGTAVSACSLPSISSETQPV